MPNPSQATPPESVRSGRRRMLLLAAALGFVLAGAGYGTYWALVARFDVGTDDAYVAGNVIQVTPQIAGTIVAVHADDVDFVQAGQPLATIDDADTRLTLERAKADLAQTVREVRTLYSNDGALAAAVSLRETNLARLQQDLTRRQRLTDTGAVSAEEVKHAQDAVQEAEAQLAGARKQQEANGVLIDNTTVAAHPRVLRAAIQLREAYLAWRRTVVPAPISGQVARRVAQVGQRTTPGVPLMTIVPLEQVWVDANFKEAQLRDMRIGQPAILTADVYGDATRYHGKVVGLAAGTGAAFSLLPAQNTTGNWIKVVQRVPVRIALDARELAAHPLRVGLSMQVDVDVRDRDGSQLSIGRQRETVAETTVFSALDRDADVLIERIIAQNAGTEPGRQPSAGAAGR